MTHLSGTDNPPITNRDNFVSRSLLLDWYLQFNQVRDLNVRLGQYKVAYSRDRVVSSGNLQLVDRTLLNQEFNLDRDIGIDVRSKDLFGLDKRLRYYLGISNGDGHSQYEMRDFGFMYLGRVEVLPFGSFDDYSQSDLKRTQKFGMSLGAAYARVENAFGTQGILGRRPNDGGTTDWDNVTADMTIKYRGLSFENAYFYRRGKRDPGDRTNEMGLPIATEAARNGWGAGVQAGYLLPSIDLELAARYSAVRASKGETALGDGNEVGVGLNYFLALHAYKLQLDWIRQWGEGIRAAGEDFADGEDRIRLQLQAAY
jgi:phosphate-selective porin OprO and OprP